LVRTKILAVNELPDVLTPQMAADYLGVSRGTIYTLCQIAPDVGGLRSYTIGNGRKIDLSDLIAWKEARKKESMSRFQIANN
jgi:excisionase family DNA binding protein